MEGLRELVIGVYEGAGLAAALQQLEPLRPRGALSIDSALLPAFSFGALLSLDVTLCVAENVGRVARALKGCQQLRGLCVDCCMSEPPQLGAELLGAIAALPGLQYLKLSSFKLAQAYTLARLAAGCRALKWLTLVWVAPLSHDVVAALMAALKALRWLRLLACQGGPSQEQCQAMLGQLQLYELLVDVVEEGQWYMGCVQARCLLKELGKQWMEESSLN